MNCEGCIGERASWCDATFYTAACSLSTLVMASESSRSSEQSLDFAAENKRTVIDSSLASQLLKIGCTLTEPQIQEKLQEEVESL